MNAAASRRSVVRIESAIGHDLSGMSEKCLNEWVCRDAPAFSTNVEIEFREWEIGPSATGWTR